MSYHIFYGKQFIKLSTGDIIPMVLGGDNNCYESTGAGSKRARNFYVSQHMTEGKYHVKPEEIVRNAEQDIQEEIGKCETDEWRKKEGTTPDMIRKNFGYYTAISMHGGGCNGTSDEYLNFWKTGIKKAKSIEELAALNIRLQFRPYYYPGYQYSLEPTKITIRTEAEYFEELARWQQWKDTCTVTDRDGNKKRPLVYLYFSQDYEHVQRILQEEGSRVKQERQYTTIEQDHYFTLVHNGHSLRKYTSRGYQYSFSEENGKPFRTEKEAEKYRKQLVDKKRHQAEQWKVKRIERKARFKVAA